MQPTLYDENIQIQSDFTSYYTNSYILEKRRKIVFPANKQVPSIRMPLVGKEDCAKIVSCRVLLSKQYKILITFINILNIWKTTYLYSDYTGKTYFIAIVVKKTLWFSHHEKWLNDLVIIRSTFCIFLFISFTLLQFANFNLKRNDIWVNCHL